MCRPSPESTQSRTDRALDPGAFLPLVQRCAGARPLAVRHVAAQALSPLVTGDALPGLLLQLLESLPERPPIASHNQV